MGRDDDDAYSSIMTGKLSFKKEGLRAAGKISKKRKRKARRKAKKDASSAEMVTIEELNKNKAGRDPKFAHMTDSEYRFEMERRKREAEAMKDKAKTTHRERVKDFNEKLDALPQHFDLPKVALTIG